ncbi:hypothetical protein OsI_22721 [Oryza sativa Indica Group]|uniref:Uncharacterized protein n=1 Tax=Oryza sativa subsp. indica TaxID=39946 RepID=B8B136_ORYSI|nr:hypothetical protein OsI_22721 [Oryza sativa Indica Group]
MSFFTCLGTLSQSRSSSFNFSTLPMPGRGSNSAKDGRDQMIFSRYGGIGGSTQSISPPPPPHASPRFLLLLPAGGGAAPDPPTQAPHHRISPEPPTDHCITAVPLVLPAGGGAGRATPEPPARYLFSHIFSVISFCQTD